MFHACELDGEDISIYFGIMSTESLTNSLEKQNVMQAYAHISECGSCRDYYEDFKKNIREKGALFNGKRVRIDFELFSRNEKIIEALFRN